MYPIGLTVIDPIRELGQQCFDRSLRLDIDTLVYS